MEGRAYIVICLATLLLGAGLVASVNILVDPYGLFGVVEIEGFNAEKPERDGSRTLKSLQLRRQPYDVVFLGSSRVQLGMHPGSPVLDGARAYNLGLVDVSMVEMEGVVDYMLRHQRPRTVVIGIDLISFDARHATNGDYAVSGFAGASPAQLYLPRIGSLRALADSVSTVFYNLSGAKRSVFDPHGALHRPRNMPYDYREAFRHMIAYYANWEFYTDFAYGPENVRSLRRSLRQLLRRNIRVHLFVSPVHASQLEVMRLMGLYDEFERVKRDLVAITAGLDAGDHLQLWDFTGYNNITIETLPRPGSGEHMRWYWEQAHYKRETGDMILARMLGGEEWADRVPADFGVRLAPEMIEAHLAAIRRGRVRFHESNKAALAIIEDIVGGHP